MTARPVTVPGAVTPRVRRPSPAVGRWTVVAGGVYVAAWLVGLVVAPSSPSNTASAADVHAYYLAHGGQALIQSLLVHGLAGVALAGLAVLLALSTRTRRPVVVAGLGITAAVVSFVQVGLAVAATHGVAGAAAATSRSLFHGINLADSVKLLFLGAFVAAATLAAARARLTALWVRILGYVLAPLLPIGGAAYLVGSSALMRVLELALVLLLIWSGATAWMVGRRS